jgi:hypothetical protein
MITGLIFTKVLWTVPDRSCFYLLYKSYIIQFP